MSEERMDLEEQVSSLNAALRLQNRSVLQYALTAGSLTGFDFQPLAGDLGRFAAAELDDARRLTEKITALGGDPTPEVAPLRFEADGRAASEWLIETETEALETLRPRAGRAGREAASEAIEHRLET